MMAWTRLASIEMGRSTCATRTRSGMPIWCLRWACRVTCRSRAIGTACRKGAATGKLPCCERLAKAECANDKHIPLWLWRDEAALNAARMSGFRDRWSHHLSMKEKKRIAIATVLSMNPQILVLDEPSAGSDPRARRTLINLLRE